MKKYSGFEWLLIDAATQFGLDKLTFEERIEWTKSNLNNLEGLTNDAETEPLYYKAVLAIRKAQQNIPTGHMVGVDACCSGAQIMSSLTGCTSGGTATGLVDPDRRADAYTDTTSVMNRILGGGINVSRKDAKRALMTSMYGSKATPKEIFGEDTPQLKAFYQAVTEVAPGAWALLHVLLNSWNPMTLVHRWKLPDGYDAVVKVMVKQTARIEVDDLDHSSFTYEFYENQGTKTGLSNAANVIHSVDAYILREMHRRCNYNHDVITQAKEAIEVEMNKRNLGLTKQVLINLPNSIDYFKTQYDRSTHISSAVLPHINRVTVSYLSDVHLQGLYRIACQMLGHKPFPLVTVHDEFKAHANNVNQVRFHYKEILAELAESNVLDDLLSQVYGQPVKFEKLSSDLATKIRNSNYALC